MTKVEMAAHAAAYQDKVTVARTAETTRLYNLVIRNCKQAWPYFDGMQRHCENANPGGWIDTAAMGLVLGYSPLLLDLNSLTELEEFIRSSRRLQKLLGEDVGSKIKIAKSATRANFELWRKLERMGSVHLASVRAESTESVTYQHWVNMGLLRMRADNYTLATKLGEVVEGKCSRCGKISEAPKAVFFGPVDCPVCATRGANFVIIPNFTEARR